MKLLPLVSLAVALVSYASPAPFTSSPLDFFGPHTTKHAWSQTPANWKHIGSPPDSHSIRLRIGLKQSNFDELVRHLYEVSDPNHDRYGQYLSKEEVEEFVKPSDESVQMVETWLAAHGLDLNSPACDMQRSPAGDFISMNVPIRVAEQMLDTEYAVYQHEQDELNRIVRAMSYSLPKHLHRHIDVVSPTTFFGGMKAMKSTAFRQPGKIDAATANVVSAQTLPGPSGLQVPVSCNTTITPTCLAALYGATGYTPKATHINKIGIAGYLEQFANIADLGLFTAMFRPDAANASFTLVEFNGGQNDQSNPGVEANLDIQTTTGLTFPTPNTYFSTGGSPPFIPDSNTPTDTNEPYDKFIDGLLTQSSIPPVISTSYGDDEQTVPPDFAVRVCASFAQIGARGTSILFSSGDDGVGGGDCLTNDGKNQTLFQPAFPASCPFVTTVGATTQFDPEITAFFSGGGFSRLFPQPSYQASVVDKYVKGLDGQFKGLFNPAGRAYPDVSAQGLNFEIFVGGELGLVGGTSASCPTVSSIITLVNDFRLSHGKAPLGFLNPLLYANPGALNDVTIGSAPGCNTNGFPAVKGWDPVTGLGTPNFLKLIKL